MDEFFKVELFYGGDLSVRLREIKWLNAQGEGQRSELGVVGQVETYDVEHESAANLKKKLYEVQNALKVQNVKNPDHKFYIFEQYESRASIKVRKDQIASIVQDQPGKACELTLISGVKYPITQASSVLMLKNLD